ncbi:hypothetical protein [Aquabacterium sp.]|uniref:hypothetical protein n=1 Tax=Aquabacterium sp. TaxID=1872578 RepID=UPI0035B2F0FB
MARNVIRSLVLICAAQLACGLPVARAMGPQAPFAAPDSAAPEQALLDDGAVNVQGLAGVRLGHQAGAVIDGTWVPKGRTVRGATLETVTRRRVTLRYPDGHTESLDLFPPTSAGAGAASASRPNEAPPK